MASKKVNIDKTDKAILHCLSIDTRASIADIARDIGVQRDTVSYRIERMEKRGLIMKYHTIIDPLTLGCDIFMMVLIKTAPVEKKVVDDFLSALVAHPNVTHVSRLVGKYDYLLQMAASDIIAFDEALDQVKAIQSGMIIETEISSIIDGLKIDDFGGLIEST